MKGVAVLLKNRDIREEIALQLFGLGKYYCVDFPRRNPPRPQRKGRAGVRRIPHPPPGVGDMDKLENYRGE